MVISLNQNIRIILFSRFWSRAHNRQVRGLLLKKSSTADIKTTFHPSPSIYNTRTTTISSPTRMPTPKPETLRNTSRRKVASFACISAVFQSTHQRHLTLTIKHLPCEITMIYSLSGLRCRYAPPPVCMKKLSDTCEVCLL